ncbi:membrane protein [Ralstonia solanacearum]|uniref:PilN domain-containing protein n=1 Tax=Ralstonia solanacearum TaxID=305 RepID=A0AAE3T2W1_RALSL|nr:membrane protein [Ralstonia solanacearum]KFX81160.1 membrane protein [Ralstonia solanacearum]MBB6581477.1 hypothetical protein [Ralstonia solanacearum]MDB0521471.1 PilN domain-containing protein [Ralstonia solanacearum]
MMSPLAIDFAKRRTGPTAVGGSLLIAAAVLTALAGSALWRAYQSNDRARAELAKAAAGALSKQRVEPPEPTALAKQAAKDSRKVLAELTVPWQDLLAIVEGYRAQDVALIGIDQTPAQGQIRITAEAKDFDALIGYLKYLQRSTLLREAVLNTHLIETTVPGVPVRFQITAVWRKP